jgi:predicted transposase YdaD
MLEETGYENHLQLRYEEGQKAGLEKGLQQGLETGRQEGLETGRQEGLETGRQEGLETGQQQKAQEIARTMLAQGMEPSLVAQVTGLSPDQIAALAQDRQ